MRNPLGKMYFDKQLDIETLSLSGRIEIPSHFHDFYEIGYIKSGSTKVVCKDIECIISKGDVVIFNPNDNHSCSEVNGEHLEFRCVNISIRHMKELGYCVHAYNAVFLNSKWIKLDARGNKPELNAQFSTDEPILAYKNRAKYDEYFWRGIYAFPHIPTMKMLEKASCLQDIIDNIPDMIEETPDIQE